MDKNNGNGKKELLLKPRNGDVNRLEMGRFYFLNQKYDEAIKEFELALTENTNNPEIYYNLGLVYETKGQFNPAKEAFNNALEIDPGHKPSEEHLAKLVGG